MAGAPGGDVGREAVALGDEGAGDLGDEGGVGGVGASPDGQTTGLAIDTGVPAAQGQGAAADLDRLVVFGAVPGTTMGTATVGFGGTDGRLLFGSWRGAHRPRPRPAFGGRVDGGLAERPDPGPDEWIEKYRFGEG